METAKETGGPAFPCEIQLTDQDVYVSAGMSLRDYFAAKAMQGLIHHFDFGTFRNDPERLAGWAYDAADAMLKAREQ
jgi:hypothetical protein